MSDIIQLAQLGCGYWGPNLVRNFSAQPGCRIKWVVDTNPSRRQFIEQHYPQVQTTVDSQAAIDDPQVQGVIVATPASTHYGLVKAALEGRKHVLVEKPLALNVQEADELVELSRAVDRVLMVGHTFLYNAAVRYIKQLIDKGDLGEVYYLYSQRLNLGQVRQDVNVWWNLGPHDVSILMYLKGGRLPLAVAAQGYHYIQPGVEDVVFATLTWADRTAAHVHVSWLDPGKVRKMTVVGSRKMVVYDDVSDDKIAVIDKGVDRVPRIGERMDYDRPNGFELLHRTGDVLLPRINFQEPLRVESGHFLECIRTGQTPLTGAEHARDVVAVLEAGQRSLRNGGACVSVQSVCRNGCRAGDGVEEKAR